MKRDESEYLKRLGKHIAKTRKSKGYTQDQLSLAAGFSQGTVSKIENGLVDPQILTLLKMAEIIGVPLKRLLDVISPQEIIQKRDVTAF